MIKKIAWLAGLILIIVSACSGSGPESLPADSHGGGGTPTPISNLPGQVEEDVKPPERDRFDPEQFSEAIGDYVLRPEDLPNDYRIPQGGEHRLSNLGVIQDRGEVEGKHYIVDTGRVDGWHLELERKKKEDIAPGTMASAIELFESSEGAELALSRDWFKAYREENKTPNWIEDGCNFGNQCLFYYYQSIDPATNLTKLEYDVAFVYRNVMVWVMGRGLDIDVTPDYILNAAEALFMRLKKAS